MQAGRPTSTVSEPGPDANRVWNSNRLFEVADIDAGRMAGGVASKEVRRINVPALSELAKPGSSHFVPWNGIIKRYERLIDGLALMKENWKHSLPHLSMEEARFANARIRQIDIALSKANQYLHEAQTRQQATPT